MVVWHGDPSGTDFTEIISAIFGLPLMLPAKIDFKSDQFDPGLGVHTVGVLQTFYCAIYSSTYWLLDRLIGYLKSELFT